MQTTPVKISARFLTFRSRGKFEKFYPQRLIKRSRELRRLHSRIKLNRIFPDDSSGERELTMIYGGRVDDTKREVWLKKLPVPRRIMLDGGSRRRVASRHASRLISTWKRCAGGWPKGSQVSRVRGKDVLALVNRARYHFATTQTMRTHTQTHAGFVYRIRSWLVQIALRSIFHRKLAPSVHNFIFNPQPYEKKKTEPPSSFT